MRRRWVTVLGLIAAAAGQVRADDEPGAQPVLITPTHPQPAPRRVVIPDDSASHAGQFGISARIALIGLSTVKPYKSTDYCGSIDSDGSLSAVCLDRMPITLALEPSYGVGRHVELVVEFDLGLETDFRATRTALSAGPHLFQVAPGARFFFSEGRHSKLFTTAQAVVDFSNYQDANGKSRGDDLGVRNLSGLWYDFNRNYAAYFFVGETVTGARWLRLDLEAGIGVQARFP